MVNESPGTTSGTRGDYAYRETGRERSMGDVLKDIFGNVQEMVRSEIRLARAEIKEEAGKTVNSARLLGAGAVAALFALGFLLVAVGQGLANVMPDWGASLVVGVVLGVAGAVLLSEGRRSWQCLYRIKP
ncbi:MAG: phage holin family protein [Bryobacteraceae bacterium]|nr:phage holin family protein [Bryobacteraceae bacterium]